MRRMSRPVKLGSNYDSPDEALHALAEKDERKSRIVELRYSGGLSIEGTSEVLGLSPTTVRREWTMTKAWLRREIRRGTELVGK